MKSLIIAAFLGLATMSSAKVVHVDKKRVIQITGPIYSTYKPASKLIELANKNTKPVYILIDSNGGSVVEGIRFMRIMDRAKARGVKIKCVVTGHAMSMAFSIFSNCSERYAMPLSLLMWHPAYVQGNLKLTEKDANALGYQIKLLTEYLNRIVRNALRLPESVYQEYYENEYITLAWDLKRLSPTFVTLVSDVQ